MISCAYPVHFSMRNYNTPPPRPVIINERPLKALSEYWGILVQGTHPCNHKHIKIIAFWCKNV